MKPERYFPQEPIVAECLGELLSLEIHDSTERMHMFRLDIDDPEYPNGTYFIAKYSRVLQALYHLNRNLALGSIVILLNDLYNFLRIPETSHGNDVGWSINDEYVWIDFEIIPGTECDGREVYYIRPAFEPDDSIYEYLR